MLNYQHNIDNSLGSTNVELLELKTKFTKMESDIAISVKPLRYIREGNVWKFQAFLNQLLATHF